MNPDRVSRLIESELSRASEPERLTCLEAAERLLQNCIRACPEEDHLRYSELLNRVRSRISDEMT
jgi:hypothetical protein